MNAREARAPRYVGQDDRNRRKDAYFYHNTCPQCGWHTDRTGSLCPWCNGDMADGEPPE